MVKPDADCKKCLPQLWPENSESFTIYEKVRRLGGINLSSICSVLSIYGANNQKEIIDKIIIIDKEFTDVEHDRRKMAAEKIKANGKNRR